MHLAVLGGPLEGHEEQDFEWLEAQLLPVSYLGCDSPLHQGPMKLLMSSQHFAPGSSPKPPEDIRGLDDSITLKMASYTCAGVSQLGVLRNA